MYKLIYVSTATRIFSLDEIDALLMQSCEKNKKLGITGMMIYRDGNFIQFIEGEKKAVKALYESIARDRRHFDCVVLDEGDESERCFGEWSMKFKQFDWKPLFTQDELANDKTGGLALLSDFAFNMR